MNGSLPAKCDVLIIGAGISGIGAAYHLQHAAPNRSYAIVEARDNLGGTWDLFRYPGVRSDSDMYTFGFTFKPWEKRSALASGAEIKAYLTETVQEHGIDKHLYFDHRVIALNWCSRTCVWTVEMTTSANTSHRVTCRFVFSCGGYFNYERGHQPTFPGQENYRGQVIHPQCWPAQYDCRDKRLIVIGSGATAMTLVPQLARQAAHVTLLQRSPTYVISRPAVDGFATALRKLMPLRPALTLARWRNVLGGIITYWLCRRFPALMKNVLIKKVRNQVGEDFDVERHFLPRYNPWDQRICLVPDGDLFAALTGKRASIVTATIKRFTATGIELDSGEVLSADAIITATGLKVEVFSGITVNIDGRTIDPSATYCYKGLMLNELPNLAFSVGYTNASWTLKSELVARYVARLLNHMQNRRYDWCIARVPQEGLHGRPLLDISANYIQRARHLMPQQGAQAPWKLHQNYLLDCLTLTVAPLEDGTLTFGRGAMSETP